MYAAGAWYWCCASFNPYVFALLFAFRSCLKHVRICVLVVCILLYDYIPCLVCVLCLTFMAALVCSKCDFYLIIRRLYNMCFKSIVAHRINCCSDLLDEKTLLSLSSFVHNWYSVDTDDGNAMHHYDGVCWLVHGRKLVLRNVGNRLG